MIVLQITVQQRQGVDRGLECPWRLSFSPVFKHDSICCPGHSVDVRVLQSRHSSILRERIQKSDLIQSLDIRKESNVVIKEL